MSELVDSVCEQNNANTKELTALPTETVEDVTKNNIESALKAVPEAVETVISAANKDLDGSGSKPAEEKQLTSPKVVDNKKTPIKRTPTKRMSYIERAQKESEELVKNMGGNLEIEGGRRTRSSTRGTPTRSAMASTPPPAKKARTSPASGAATPTRQRGRGRKIDVTGGTGEETQPTPSKYKTPPTKGKKVTTKNVADEIEEVVGKSEDAKKGLAAEQPEEEKDATKETPLSSEKNRKESTDKNFIENPIDDKTDGALETAFEETQSQAAADLLSTEKNVTKGPENTTTSAHLEIVSEVSKLVKSDSAMESEDAKSIECLTEKNEAKLEDSTPPAVKELQKAKEPTPEPMEVDSSSKSNDGLEQMDDDVVEINEDETKVVQEPIKVLENQQTKSADIKSKKLGELNHVENIEDDTKENPLVSSAIAAPPAAVGSVANNSIHANTHENNIEETKPAANDLNKTENDLCEPKIATSPPISAANDNSNVTTPQTCN